MKRHAMLRLAFLVLFLGIAVGVIGASAEARSLDACGLPDAKPLWIDYGGGAVPREVRDVFARPGVILATSGTALPKSYREKGAQTVFFVLNLPRLVGDPDEPADPATVQAAVERTYDEAVESTTCSTPIIGLNELLGPAAPVPWSASVAQYRANVLALLQGLSDRGARPALLIHGNPGLTGEAAAWWRNVGAVADVVYESYYNATVITRLGRIVGTRRIRLGMRSVARRFVDVGVPRERIGFVLGFQVAIGAAGREGLQPSADWFRFVKWNALAAQQVVREEGSSSIWSWGWANFGPQSVDPDKPAAACVYLWARDPSLCDGAAAAGPGFNTSRVEGTITMPADVLCTSASGKIRERDVGALTRVAGSRQAALTTLFTRQALRRRMPITAGEILEYEQRVIERHFEGSRNGYIGALRARGATVEVARGAIADELRRTRIAALLTGGVIGAADAPNVATWIADNTRAEATTATCRRDALPGTGDFPASNDREIGSAPLLRRLSFLGADEAGPVTPADLEVELTAGGAATALSWEDSPEADVIGYLVYRKLASNGTFAVITPLWLPRSTFVDRTAERGAPAIYIVRAVDASGNMSAPTPEVGVVVPK